MDCRLDLIWVTVFALIKDAYEIDRYAYDVVPFGNSGNVDPLAGELLVIPVAPT